MDPITRALMMGAAGAGSEAAPGQVAYTSPGSYSWTCPVGVTSVSVVVIGGGGGGSGSSGWGAGGGGGAIRWMNNYAVTPGNSYSVMVGNAGLGGNFSGTSDGGTSSFDSTVYANGGLKSPGRSLAAAGGSGSGGTAGFSGGAGSAGTPSPATLGFGGGAGNYDGNGQTNGDGTSLTGNNTGTLGRGANGGTTIGLNGQSGGVRVIWPGTTRSFPSTNVGDL